MRRMVEVCGGRAGFTVGVISLLLGVGVIVFAGVELFTEDASPDPSPISADAATTLSDGTVVTTSTLVTTTTSPPPTTTTEPRRAIPPTTIANDDTGLAYELVAEGLDQPVAAVLVPGTVDSFYVVEQPGRVVLLEGGDTAVVLDITDVVVTEFGEKGLLGLALHPDFTVNRRAFVAYLGDDGSTFGALHVAEVEIGTGPLPTSPIPRVLLEVPQEGQYHLGGSMRFGPDGMLWIGVGDGTGDHNGQDRTTLNGSLVRIDVDTTTGDLAYGIPPGNAFPDGQGGAPEIWAYGLRNPWSFAFDGDRIFIFDVGTHLWEEINLARLGEPGANFGWADKEGPECVDLAACQPDPAVVDPWVAASHGGLCAIVGGPVYRGSAIPALEGHLVWATFCAGKLTTTPMVGDAPQESIRWTGLPGLRIVTAIAVDGAGEVYLLKGWDTSDRENEGQIFKLVPSGAAS